MIEAPNAGWTDEQIVGHFTIAAIAYGNCGLNMDRADKVAEKALFPCGTILTRRGVHSLGKLLPLTNDENPTVRLWSAVFAFDLAPDACRHALEELLREDGVVKVLARVELYQKDLETRPRPAAY
jgi:hypothetical protein